MENLDGSFISKELKETFKDVLYGTKTDKHDFHIVFLFEHKSTADKLAIVQVGRYMMDLWEKSLQESNEMPVVIPIIFYHGESTWNYHTDMRKYIRNYEQLSVQFKDRLPTMKHDFIKSVDEVYDQVPNEDIELYVPLLLVYISSANRDFNKRELMRNIKNMEGKGEAIMTILEESKPEGRQEGRKEAAANMLENGFIHTYKVLVAEETCKFLPM